MKQMIHKMYNPANEKLGLFVLRLTLGSIFMVHGISKLSNMEGTIGFFGMIGFSAFWAWVVALVETIGGAAVILGIWTRMVSSLLAITMIVAIFSAKSGKGFGGSELEIALLGLSLGIGLIGCGKWSMCNMWHKKDCKTCKDGVCCGCNCESK
jgi:uncharacterized membrane protein YphA (DoxX/SURF4 family)